MKFPTRAALALACALAATVPAVADAAPITVNLRVEGASKTLFEGPIRTDARTDIVGPDAEDASSGTIARPCNYKDNGGQGGFGASYGGPTTAVYDAMQQTGQGFAATWYGTSLKDFIVTQLGSDVNGAPGYWGFAVNYTESSVGGCQYILANNAEVIWAYDSFGKPYLKLTGPNAVTAGEPATYNVINAQSGDPLAGARVGGGTTDGNGNVVLTFPATGVQTLKAERDASVRSNALAVNVTAKGATPAAPPAGSGQTGTTAVGQLPVDRARPLAKIASPRNKATYRARFAPRRLRAEVEETGSGVTSVRMRLTRQVGKRCWQYSVKRERFVGIRCGRGTYQEVTRQASFEYLLPERLRRGRYVFDVTATDRSQNRDTFRSSGRNRVVFTVK